MTNSPATALPPRRISTRAWLILFAVVVAVAIPILPLRFLGVPGPDLPDVGQVVTTSKDWLSKVAANFDHSAADGAKRLVAASPGASAADQVKMLDAAAQRLTQEIEQSPSDPGLHNKLGLVYLSLGDVDMACEHFQKAVSLCRLGLNALSDKIASYRAESRTKEAAETLLEASQLNVQLSAAHSNLARVFEKRGEHDKVVAELDMLNREGVLFDNTMAQAQPGVANNLLNQESARDLARAEALMQAGKLQLAGNIYRLILSRDPNIAMAHHRLGTILALNNNAASAVDELEMAAKLDPGSPEIQNDLGVAYKTLGLSAQAVKSFEKAMALDPRATEAAINLSDLYSGRGQLDNAISALVECIQNNPDSAKAHNNLGTLLSLQSKYGPALYEFQKAVALAPNMPSAHYGLGNVLLQTKSYIPAVHEFKQALALNPSFSEAQLKIEEAYRKAGQGNLSAQAL